MSDCGVREGVWCKEILPSLAEKDVQRDRSVKAEKNRTSASGKLAREAIDRTSWFAMCWVRVRSSSVNPAACQSSEVKLASR